MSQEQIVNAPNLYLDGLNLSFISNTTLGVAIGQCRDSTNVLDIFVNSPLVINGAVNGANGLDAGTLAINTAYWVFLIADFQGFNPAAALISTSATAPYLPTGYGAFRRIGRCYTNSGPHFLDFKMSGRSTEKFVQFTNPLAVLSGGSSATFAAVNLLIGEPGATLITPVYLNVTYTPNTAASTASIRPTGSAATATNCPVELKGNVNAVSYKESMVKILPGISTSTLSIDYAVTASDALSLAVAAFEESL